MCGLVSIIARQSSGFYAMDLDLFEQMLILDQFRGKDSAGAMMTMRGGDQHVIKHATKHITLMFETQDWRNFRGKAISSGRFLTGHNRHSTRGKSTTENAHPFVEGRITLAHNGTIWNQKELAPDATVEVDSNAIAIALDEDEVDKVIPKINGAFSLIWYNNEEEKLHAIRNDERPLHLITTNNFYFLMSEPWMMIAPYGRQSNRAKVEEVRELIPGELLTWDLNGKMESRGVSLCEKKSTGGTNTTQDTYANWCASEHNRKYHRASSHSSATKEVVEGKGGACDPMEDTIPPFDQGVTDSTPPQQELTNIRDILTRSAKLKQAREAKETPSTSCALTSPSVSLVSTTKTPLNENLIGGTGQEKRTDDVSRYIESQEGHQRNIIVDNPNFKKGDFTMVKIWSTWAQGKFMRWSGKVTMPGKPIIDAVGVLPEGVQPQHYHKWAEVACTGKVRFCTYTTGGLSVFVEDLLMAGYTDVHGEDVPWVMWNRALVQGCDTCAGQLLDWERPYTLVKAKGVVKNGITYNTLRCICPDCLMKGLPEGEIYDSYTKRYYEAKGKHDRRCAAEGRTPSSRNPSVQNREQLSPTVVRTDGGAIILPGSQTLQ